MITKPHKLSKPDVAAAFFRARRGGAKIAECCRIVQISHTSYYRALSSSSEFAAACAAFDNVEGDSLDSLVKNRHEGGAIEN
jgi:hypothetical protein